MIRKTVIAVGRHIVGRLMPRPSAPPEAPTPPNPHGIIDALRHEVAGLRVAYGQLEEDRDRLMRVVRDLTIDNAALRQEVLVLQAKWRDR